METAIPIALFVLAVLFGVIGWLLSRKDSQQEKEIEKLGRLYEEHKKEFNDHRVLIANNHYQKPELDERFRQLSATITNGFHDVREDIKGIGKIWQEHINEQHRRGG